MPNASLMVESDVTDALPEQLQGFRDFGTETRLAQTPGQLLSDERITVPTYVNEFWTAKQRQASSLHEVSYRACFKPQLPRFFIDRLTQPGLRGEEILKRLADAHQEYFAERIAMGIKPADPVFSGNCVAMRNTCNALADECFAVPIIPTFFAIPRRPTMLC